MDTNEKAAIHDAAVGANHTHDGACPRCVCVEVPSGGRYTLDGAPLEGTLAEFVAGNLEAFDEATIRRAFSLQPGESLLVGDAGVKLARVSP